MEARRAQARAQAYTQAKHAADRLETALCDTEGGALRAAYVARWRGEQSAVQLRRRAERLCEQALSRYQSELARVRDPTTEMAELREVGLRAVRTADADALYAMAVQEAVADGADVNMRPAAAAGEQERWLKVLFSKTDVDDSSPSSCPMNASSAAWSSPPSLTALHRLAAHLS